MLAPPPTVAPPEPHRQTTAAASPSAPPSAPPAHAAAGTPPRRGWVLVTGASTGIGRACAVELSRAGFGVFAGVRRECDGSAVEADAAGHAGGVGGTVRHLLLDVTDDGEVAAAVGRIDRAVGPGGLAGVVNNAGISVAGPVEFVPVDHWRRQFEVNLFGLIAVTQATLPLLRARVAAAGRGSARIVNMSSIAGRIAQPVLGPYGASKFAIESVSDSLRLELRAQGIPVCLVEPGAVDTHLWDKACDAAGAMQPGHAARTVYGRLIDGVLAGADRAHSHACHPSQVARAVVACLTKRRPPTRTFVGLDAKSGAMAKRFLPDRFFDVMVGRYYAVPR